MLVKQRIQVSARSLVVFALGLAFVIGNVQPVAAVSSQTNTANTLKVSPVRSDIEVKAGESYTVKVGVTNLTGGDISVRPVTNDFIAGDERGTPALILDADKFAPTHSLKKYMKPIADIVIPAGKLKMVDVVIEVPKDAQAGGYFGAIRFAPTTPDSGGEVNLSASVASLILMTVPGPTTEKLDMTEFEVQQNAKNGKIFRTPDNLQVTFRFTSSSNVQVAPFGKISVKKGNKTVYESDFNQTDPRQVILPDSARRWDVPIQNIDGFFGKYTAYATLTYGKSNQTIEVQKDFWIISWAAIAIAAGGLLLLTILVTVIVLLIRRNRKHRSPRRLHNSGGFRR